MPLESRKSALSCDLSTLTATGDAEIHVYFESSVADPKWLFLDPNLTIRIQGQKETGSRDRIPNLDPQQGISVF